MWSEWCLYTPHLGVRSSRILQDFESRLDEKQEVKNRRDQNPHVNETQTDVREKDLNQNKGVMWGQVTWFNYNVRSDISLIVL